VVERGAKVRVLSVSGLLLRVEPMDPGPHEAGVEAATG
jgi:hypothetical protein